MLREYIVCVYVLRRKKVSTQSPVHFIGSFVGAKINRPKRTFDPANRLYHGVVEE